MIETKKGLLIEIVFLFFLYFNVLNIIPKSFKSILANIFYMLDKYIEFHFQNCDREVMSIEHEIRTMIVLEFASQFIIGVAKELWTKR